MKRIILLILVIAIITAVTTFLLISNKNYLEKQNELASLEDINEIENQVEENEQTEDSGEAQEELETEDTKVDKHSLSDVDLVYLKLENKKENIVYSPLSIKYAMKMLEEATSGESKEQVAKVFENSLFKNYDNSKNMSIANAMFIKDAFKENVKESYIETIKEEYSGEVIFDKFENGQAINSWVKNKTFNIIPEIIDDESARNISYALVNSVAIDMEWVNRFVFPLRRTNIRISS